jgi:transposase
MVIDWMGEKLGVTYKKVQIYNIMNRLGFSYQKAKGSDRRSGMGSYNYESGR